MYEMKADPASFKVRIVSAELTTREHMTRAHLIAACRFSQTVRDIEQAHAGQSLATDMWDAILSDAIACIFTATASLEAYAYEIFKDSGKNFPREKQQEIAENWNKKKKYERRSLLEKFAWALKLLDKAPFAETTSPYRDVAALIELRHGLTHFSPEASNERIRHTEISNSLEALASRSPFYSPTDPLFPRSWACHASTSWAVKATFDFMSEFARLSGLEDRAVSFTPRPIF